MQEAAISTLVAIAVCAICAASPQSAEALTVRLQSVAYFADHPLVPVDQPGRLQLSVVGQLERHFVSTKDGLVAQYASAIVVSPCYILTNHHVAYGDDDTPLYPKDYSMTFRAGVGDDTDGFFGHTTARPVIAGDFAHSKRNDWTLIRLDRCAGALPQIGWIEQSQTPAADLQRDSTIALVGFTTYPDSSKVRKLQLSLGNLTGLEQYTHLWKASSSVTHGESGGPVLSIEGGRLRLVGLIVGDTRSETDDLVEYDHYVDLRASFFISSFEVLNRPDIKRLLDEDKRSYVNDNPAELRLRSPFPIDTRNDR